MPNRSATDTIIGYFYQFDKTILEILNSSDSDEVHIEGIEDIDIINPTETTAIQCKYYAKTEYNHSVISKAIRFMAQNYKSLIKNNKKKISYMIYGYYKSGQTKLEFPLDIEFVKDNFFTYTKDRKTHKLHEEIDLTDIQIKEFISLLEIDIDAKSYEDQKQEIIKTLSQLYSCTLFEAEYYFYNNAIAEIKKIATQDDDTRIKILKKDFLITINKKILLFNLWFIEQKGARTYYQNIKREFFSLGLNTSPYERFFLFDFSDTTATMADIKHLLQYIQNKWSKLTRRERQPFCPYVYLHQYPDRDLVKLKTLLRDENFLINDGHDFLGSSFSCVSMQNEANYHNQIKLKVINSIENFNEIISFTQKTKEIYEFYKSKTFINVDTTGTRHIKIQYTEINNIMEVLK